MSAITLEGLGEFKINQISEIMHSTGATEDYSIAFTQAKILDFHNSKYFKYLVLNYDFSDDRFTINGIYEDDTTLALSTEANIIAYFTTTAITGFAKYTFNGEQALDDNFYAINQIFEHTGIFLYNILDKNNVLNKSLRYHGFIEGKYKSNIAIKTPVIDIEGIKIPYFTYVFITDLNRYYYVESAELITKDITRLYLKEDVLMSFKDLILAQSAYIERQENDYNLDLVDELIITEYNKNVTYTTISYTNNIFKDNNNTDYTGDFVVLVVNDEVI